jgi:hypothetical protein
VLADGQVVSAEGLLGWPVMTGERSPVVSMWPLAAPSHPEFAHMMSMSPWAG